MSEPNDFNSQFKQLCAAFERTTQGEWVAGSDFVEAMEAEAGSRVICQTFNKREEDFANAENHRQWVALAHNIFPAIKEEMEQLKKDQCPHWEEPSGTLVAMWDAFAHSLSSLTSDKVNAEIKEVWSYFWQLDSTVRGYSAELSTKNEEVERLRESLTAQSEAVHFHECTVGTFYDCPNPACTKARELLETKK